MVIYERDWREEREGQNYGILFNVEASWKNF